MPKLRIFLVEDNETVSENLTDAIHEMTNAEVIAIARSESNALEWLDANTADLYIVDVMLRNGNGLKVLQKSDTSTGTWVVFSNHSMHEVAKVAMSYGADYVMDKSNEVDTLMTLIQRMASAIE